jgi:hypothetical protein
MTKPTLSEEDRQKLAKIDEALGDLPTSETPEDIQAMEIIRRAAKVLRRAADPDS